MRTADGYFTNRIPLVQGDGSRVGQIAWNTEFRSSMHLLEITVVAIFLLLVLYNVSRALSRRISALGKELDRINLYNHLEKTRLRRMIESSNDGFVLLDENGYILDCNTAITKRSLQPRSSLIGQPVRASLPDLPLDAPEFLSGRKTIRAQMKKPNGETYWLDIGGSRFEDDSSAARYIMVARGITHRLEAEREIWHQAHFHILTGLPNRTLFRTRLNAELVKAFDQDKTFILMFVDLDAFKQVNDTLGHDADDALLKIVAERFRTHVPKDVMVGRLGGDEFGVILPAGSSPQDSRARPLPRQGPVVALRPAPGHPRYLRQHRHRPARRPDHKRAAAHLRQGHVHRQARGQGRLCDGQRPRPRQQRRRQEPGLQIPEALFVIARGEGADRAEALARPPRLCHTEGYDPDQPCGDPMRLVLALLLPLATLFLRARPHPAATFLRETLFLRGNASLVQVVTGLDRECDRALAVLVGCFSILFPTVKILLLHVVAMGGRGRFLHLLAAVSKWSMMDVMVAALVVFAAKSSGLATAITQPSL
ncbi:MAG: diguanylate cyclase [Breoghania sp.]|nr:diguanylate cyclase [Breoghania sp.]